MPSEINHRPTWEIDRVLGALIGQDVRVATASFSPLAGDKPRVIITPSQLVLPDNTRAAGLPLFFEGKLLCFAREIGVVQVELDSPGPSSESSQGVTYFRGGTAVILRGPALVKLAFPFHVERIPAHPDNYWEDLRMRSVQFRLPF